MMKFLGSLIDAAAWSLRMRLPKYSFSKFSGCFNGRAQSVTSFTGSPLVRLAEVAKVTMGRTKRVLAVSVMFMAPLSANAGWIEYELRGADFIGGNGSITGGFRLNSMTGEVMDANITTGAGNLLLYVCDTSCTNQVVKAIPATTFSGSASLMVTSTGTNFFDLASGALWLRLAFDGPFPEGGGIKPLARANQWECPTSEYCDRVIRSTPFRSAVGVGEAAAVPAPASFALVALGTIGIGAIRRKRVYESSRSFA